MTGAGKGPVFRFRSEWSVAAPPGETYDVLEDVAAYPTWWPQVRAVASVEDEVALTACRSVLPYTLHIELRPQVRDRPGVLVARLDGDLVGTCRWELVPVPGGTHLVFTQEVSTAARWLDVGARLARPVLVLNHRWMMRGARRGLVARLRTPAPDGGTAR